MFMIISVSVLLTLIQECVTPSGTPCSMESFCSLAFMAVIRLLCKDICPCDPNYIEKCKFVLLLFLTKNY